jgi:hypothetical protein
LWPKLKVLVIGGHNVNIQLDNRHHLIPPGIRVIDEDTYSGDGWSMLNGIHHFVDWPSLEYLRFDIPVEPDKLSRIVAPSIANGKLKTLSIASPLEQLKDLGIESQHVQALGLTLHNEDSPLFLAPRYRDWVAKFPNAHTFSIHGEREPTPVATALAAVFLRPGTKRIFERTLMGVHRDQLLEEARNQNVEVIRAGFPVIFPWELDDDDEDGDGQMEVDVVEQWRNARGRLQGSLTSEVSNQPFFRE